MFRRKEARPNTHACRRRSVVGQELKHAHLEDVQRTIDAKVEEVKRQNATPQDSGQISTAELLDMLRRSPEQREVMDRLFLHMTLIEQIFKRLQQECSGVCHVAQLLDGRSQGGQTDVRSGQRRAAHVAPESAWQSSDSAEHRRRCTRSGAEVRGVWSRPGLGRRLVGGRPPNPALR